ncbi:MAG: PD40 domain-containing protein, partial [Anaerolineales bacterium]|nr:PD40 domain-containing protein [Anaerolineales bacterium]
MDTNHRHFIACISIILAVALLFVVELVMAKTRAPDVTEMTRITVGSATDRDSMRASLSADGNLVAFQSDSDLLSQGIPYDQIEIWLYNTTEMTFTRVTTASASDRNSFSPRLNAEGTKLAFSSNSDFLSQGIPPEQAEA